MLNAEQITHFVAQASQAKQVLVAGYGSLLSHYSRSRFSQIEGVGIPGLLNGWQRAWITRSIAEQQTYVGAVPHNTAALNVQFISLAFDPSFEKREQDYKFTRIKPESIALEHQLNEHANLNALFQTRPIYICETLKVEPSNASFPVHFSYVNTCLQGCFEQAGMAGVKRFFEYTADWQHSRFKDDTKQAMYPRATPVSKPQWQLKELLSQYGAIIETE